MLFLHFFLAPGGRRIDLSSPLLHLFFLPLEKMCDLSFASSSLFYLERRWKRICHPIFFTLCFGEKMEANLSSCSPLAGAPPLPHLHQQSLSVCRRESAPPGCARVLIGFECVAYTYIIRRGCREPLLIIYVYANFCDVGD